MEFWVSLGPCTSYPNLNRNRTYYPLFPSHWLGLWARSLHWAEYQRRAHSRHTCQRGFVISGAVYIYTGPDTYYASFTIKRVWFRGFTIVIVVIATALLFGYTFAIGLCLLFLLSGIVRFHTFLLHETRSNNSLWYWINCPNCNKYDTYCPSLSLHWFGFWTCNLHWAGCQQRLVNLMYKHQRGFVISGSLYIHVGLGIYYASFTMRGVGFRGVAIVAVITITALLFLVYTFAFSLCLLSLPCLI